MAYLYRGVSAKHPAWFFASMGIVVPGHPSGSASSLEHNEGGAQKDSPYTSWTLNRAIAEFHRDKDGPGGLLLRVEQSEPGPDDLWFWEWSPDIYGEAEVLMYGVRIGIEVLA